MIPFSPPFVMSRQPFPMPQLARYLESPAPHAFLATPWETGFGEGTQVYRKTASRDADEHAEALEKWDQRYDQISPGRFSGTLTEFWLDDIQVFRESTNQSVLQRGNAWEGAGTFGIPLDMDSPGYFLGQSLMPGQMLTVGVGDNFEFMTSRNIDLVGIAVSADCFRAILDSAAALTGGKTHTAQVLQCNSKFHELRALLLNLFAALEANPARLDPPQVRKIVRSALLGHLQGALETGAVEFDTLPSLVSRKHLVEQAQALAMESHSEPVTVSELCDRLGVSRRTLQYCFQQVLGTNPINYLRAIRLNRVRRELRTSTVETLRVADVAAKWGFWHLSHFARDYRTLFGELPSETLGRR